MRWIPVVFCSVVSSVASAATLHVPKDFATIQAAVGAAVAGDTIRVAKGTYFENVVVPAGKNDLTIRGAGNGTILDARPFGPVGSGPGLDVTADGFTLANVTVRYALGFSPYGILVSGDGATVRRVKVYGCPETGICIVGDGARVEWCEIRGAERGLAIAGGGPIVRKVTSHDPEEAGIMVLATESTVRQCRVVNAGETGIVVVGSHAVVEKNVVDGAHDDGIIVDCAGDVTVRSNTVRNVAGTNGAIAVGSAVSADIAKNVAFDCNAAALYLAATLSGAHVRDNRGVRCGTPSGATFHVEAAAAVFVRNRAQDGNGDGFLLVGLNNVLEKNVALRCLMDGFDVDASAVMRKNVARSNHAEGFDVSSFGVELVGNTALANRTDVACSVPLDLFVGNAFATGGEGVLPQIDD